MSFAIVIHSSTDEPPVKKLKFALEDIPIHSPTPLNLVRPTIINNIPYEQFTTFEDGQMKQLMPFLEQGGSAPKISNIHQFSTAGECPLTIEEAKAQMKEIKSEWLELFLLASRGQSKSNDQLLKNIKAKFQWVVTQAEKVGIPHPPQLSEFELPSIEKKSDKKRKRMDKLIQEVFVNEDIVVDRMHRNLVPPSGVVA
ncbi:hypothetical protein Tco_0596357 [Tanacetum coccineum]